MSDNLIDMLFVPLWAAFVTATMVVVVLLLARKEAKDAARTAPQTEEMLQGTIRKAS